MILKNPGPKWLDITYKTSYILLLTCVASSFLLIVLPYLRKKWSKPEGYVQLPTAAGASNRKALFNKILLEYIDNGLTGEGEPVDLPGFWKLASCLPPAQDRRESLR